ncbi:pentapeptide repeat-containing protein [Streptomyces olivoreticuli]
MRATAALVPVVTSAMTPPSAPSPALPSWSHCAEGATPADPIGCRGIRVTGHTQCLAHLTPSDRTAHLSTLAPGDDVDLRGTSFAPPLLHELLTALCDSGSATPRLGNARFDHARFTGSAEFGDANFNGDARFDYARFSRCARFEGVTFHSTAWFHRVKFNGLAQFDRATFTDDAFFDALTFNRDARFRKATFHGAARFGSTTFTSYAWFDGVTFHGSARFSRARFTGYAGFHGVTFHGDAWFDHARFTGGAEFRRTTFDWDAQFSETTFATSSFFEDARFSRCAWFSSAIFNGSAWFPRARFTDRASFSNATFKDRVLFDNTTFTDHAEFHGVMFEAAHQIGPLVCTKQFDLSWAVFDAPVSIEAAAQSMVCERTRWEATATLQLRYAELDLTDALLAHPVAVTARTAPFTTMAGQPVPEPGLTGDPGVRVLSARGVDAAHLVLTNTDLSSCAFFGAFHLDKLRLEGETRFARAPSGFSARRVIPLWWADRQTLAEEQHWRALPIHRPALRVGWNAPSQLQHASSPPGPPALATLYRQLRKAFEDAKDEPGAAHFYYGEMEMRRHNRRPRNRGERALLTVYWALSGYGLRASRALSWLGLIMSATVLALMLWGLPNSNPKPVTTGIQTAPGQSVRLVTTTPTPVLTGAVRERLTYAREEKATRVVLNSVVFRSSGQNLTSTGTYIEMASRFLGPVLLALAVLAVRGRVKR